MVAAAVLDISAPDEELTIDPKIGSLYMYTAQLNIKTLEAEYQ